MGIILFIRFTCFNLLIPETIQRLIKTHFRFWSQSVWKINRNKISKKLGYSYRKFIGMQLTHTKTTKIYQTKNKTIFLFNHIASILLVNVLFIMYIWNPFIHYRKLKKFKITIIFSIFFLIIKIRSSYFIIILHLTQRSPFR